ncbi:MAG: RagB/SusD family nutrient uptake outer membrane protein [Bacteroides sp.]|nr:RagB/SusD family nutrient uptake outer membrane protein [Bacteroides sp.]
MKKNNILYGSLLLIAGLFVSCADYLDQVPDNILSLEEVFSKRSTVERYLATVYSTIPSELVDNNRAAISDEMDITFEENHDNYINAGSLTPSKDYFQSWNSFYQAIRSATIFINRVEACPDPELSDRLKSQYKAEARAPRAFYYFALFRWYGPFVINGDDEIPADADLTTMSIPRSPVDECVDYIMKELDMACEEGLLEWYISDLDYGRMTIPAARAIQARLLLYAASDLFNGNTDYVDFKNHDGEQLVNQTWSKDKWAKAAAANKYIIDNFDRFSLYTRNDDPYQSYQYLFLEDWNREVIFARNEAGYNNIEWNSPRFASGWSGWDPTQHIVDAYFTASGLPITDQLFVDKDPNYKEAGTISEDKGYALAGTWNMYVDREPRFYVSICYDNSRWVATAYPEICQLYYNGNTGKVAGTRNFSKTGYLLRKFSNPAADVKNGRMPSRSALIFRLGEIYLNYAEALNESDPGHPDILLYVNKIRERVGLRGYGTNEGDIFLKSSTQEAIRQLIRAERRVELGFENHRYFDCKRWKIAIETDGGDFWGMNVDAGRPEFYQRTVFEKRVYEFQHYLWPIPQNEIYKNKMLVQNPGWQAFD